MDLRTLWFGWSIVPVVLTTELGRVAAKPWGGGGGLLPIIMMLAAVLGNILYFVAGATWNIYKKQKYIS